MAKVDIKDVLSKVSYHVVYDNSILDALSFASKNGFSGIQIAIELPHLSFETLTGNDINKIKEVSDDLGIRISLHAPDDAPLVHTCSPISRGVIAYYSKLIDFASAVNAERITMHVGSPTFFPTDTIPEELFPKRNVAAYKTAFNNNLKTLLDLAEEKIVICVKLPTPKGVGFSSGE